MHSVNTRINIIFFHKKINTMDDNFESENQHKPKNAGFLPFFLIIAGFTVLLILGKYLVDVLSR
jgi:hypothetical protein